MGGGFGAIRDAAESDHRGSGAKKRAARRENVYSHTVAENAGIAARVDEQK